MTHAPLLDALSLRYRHPHLKCVLHLHRHAQSRQLRLLGTHAVLETAPLTQFILGISGTCKAPPRFSFTYYSRPLAATRPQPALMRPPPSRTAASKAGDGPFNPRWNESIGCGHYGLHDRWCVALACRSNVGSGGSASLGPLLHGRVEPLRSDEEIIYIGPSNITLDRALNPTLQSDKPASLSPHSSRHLATRGLRRRKSARCIDHFLTQNECYSLSGCRCE